MCESRDKLENWFFVSAGERLYCNQPGQRKLRMRQLPGADNMMGRIKFMMPNRPGIYLHDTPLKAAFRNQDRRLSSGVGCVRVEDAPRLARWLFGGSLPRSNSRAEKRIDLPEPIPVYILCLTAIPLSQRPFRPGIYLRDKPENEFRLGDPAPRANADGTAEERSLSLHAQRPIILEQESPPSCCFPRLEASQHLNSLCQFC